MKPINFDITNPVVLIKVYNLNLIQIPQQLRQLSDEVKYFQVDYLLYQFINTNIKHWNFR